MEVKRCPRAALREFGWDRFLTAFWGVTKGLWPDPGGLTDQSWEFVLAAREFDALLDEDTESDG